MTVLGPSGFTQTISLAQIAAWHDPGPTQYRTRSQPGGATTDDPLVNQPLSIRTLLGKLVPAVPIASVTQVYFDHPVKSTHTTPLTPSDLAAAGQNGFEGGLLPAVFDDGNNTIGYIRPLRAGDPSDVNTLNDYWQGAPGQPIRMTIRTQGVLLTPVVTAAPSTLPARATTQLSVSFAGNPDTTGWTYLWHFDDGTTSTLPSPTKFWTAAGSYAVTVDVTAPDSSSGQGSRTVTVTGPPVPSPSPTPGTGGGSNSNPNAPHHGPQTGHGTTTDQTPSAHPGRTALSGSDPRPTRAGAVASGTVALQTVTGTVLVGAGGTSALTDSTGSPRVDLATAGARSTSPGPWTRSWTLLVPLLLLTGAAAELKPWTRRRLAP